MRREVEPETKLHFECATHKVRLAALWGPPVLDPAVPTGSGWVVDLSNMDCPVGAEAAGRGEENTCSFRIWMDA